MATFTTRLNLTKPASSDNAEISVLNTDFDSIDSAVGATVASAASRPASTWQGRVWYAQDTDKFYVNEAANASTVAVWADPVAQALAGDVTVGGGLTVTGKGTWAYKKKAATQSYASQSTLQDDNDIVFTLAASAIYRLRANLQATGGTTGDIKTAWSFTGAASAAGTQAKFVMGPQIATTDNTATSMRTSVHNFTTAIPYGLDAVVGAFISEEGLLDTVAGSGTIRLQFAQNTSNATSTNLSLNSYAVLERLA